jgi:uncharacterized Zn finger protein
MARKRRETDPFEALTWMDLEAWAGDKIVARGKSYQRNGHVKELARTADGKLAAWVEGTERYAVLVYFDGGMLESNCTCPYWDDCKHAVATVLEYLDHIKKNVQVPVYDQKDKGLQIVEQKKVEFFSGVDRIEEDLSEGASNEFVEDFLKGLKKSELIQILNDLTKRHRAVHEAILDRKHLSGRSVKKMVDRVRAEILDLTSEPGWMNYWNNEGYIPDYTRVRDRLSDLLSGGHADDVITLGEELLEAGTEQIEMSDDEGETAEEIGSCMEVVFQALPESSLCPAEQMLWAVEAELKDNYDLCEDLVEFWNQKKAKQDWSILADRLHERLGHLKPDEGEDFDSIHYRRDRLIDWIVEALKMSERLDEALALCEKEAPKTGSYVRLVNLLKETGRKDEADSWIQKGIKATDKKWPGISTQLRETYRKIREEQRDWPVVAAIKAEDFFTRPSLTAFKELEKTAKKAKVWQNVRPAAMTYLESGKIPDDTSSWPLPGTGLPKPKEFWKRQFPLLDDLIDIAIAEKRPDEVLHWYEKSGQKSTFPFLHGHREDQIAVALKDSHPDKAIDIWKQLAEREIGLTKVKAYRSAAIHLRKIHDVMKKRREEKEWRDYIRELRQANARKPRLVEILDGLTGMKIVDR